MDDKDKLIESQAKSLELYERIDVYNKGIIKEANSRIVTMGIDLKTKPPIEYNRAISSAIEVVKGEDAPSAKLKKAKVELVKKLEALRVTIPHYRMTMEIVGQKTHEGDIVEPKVTVGRAEIDLMDHVRPTPPAPPVDPPRPAKRRGVA